MKAIVLLTIACVLLVSGCCCCCPGGGGGGDDWDYSDWETSDGGECTSDYDCGTDEYCSYGYCI